MTSQMYIDAFAHLGEPVLLRWLRNPKCDKNGDWTITAALKGLETEKSYSKPVPFGLMPYLIPGRVFHDGRAGTTPEIGQLGFATIPALREFDIAKLRDIPASVFPKQKPWNSDQELYLYRTPELDLYIPPVELVRHLFLHEKILANAILRRGALAELCVPVRPKFYRDLELHFTAAIPVSVLTRKFVTEFAWLAAHPSGAKSWKSVANLTNEKDGVRLYPPSIENSKMAFVGLIGDGAALVLEIIELPGKKDSFRWLNYTHPSFRKTDISTSGTKGRPRKGNWIAGL